ncbi:MAG TPA: hypothetical protein VHB21_17120 [Minicystis sp.]|nr:hypothetical protein [Minicystis sp.]
MATKTSTSSKAKAKGAAADDKPAAAEAKGSKAAKPAKAEPAHKAEAHAKAEPPRKAEAPPAAPPSAPAAADVEGPDVSGADAAYARLKSRIEAIPQEARVNPTVDVQDAAIVALGVDGRLREPGRRAHVEALAARGLADLAKIDALADVALAAFHARTELLAAAATSSRAILPNDLRAMAADCRKRMRDACEYNLRDEATKAQLRHLRAGRGDLDLAADLVGYAKLYAARRVELAHDKVNYRANDEALAKRLAQEIAKKLASSETPEVKQWAAAQAGAFTLLLEHYAEAARLGRFVDRDEAGEHYPSLFSASRAAPARKRLDGTTTTAPATA